VPEDKNGDNDYSSVPLTCWIHQISFGGVIRPMKMNDRILELGEGDEVCQSFVQIPICLWLQTT
jgi:hypothetical protein